MLNLNMRNAFYAILYGSLIVILVAMSI